VQREYLDDKDANSGKPLQLKPGCLQSWAWTCVPASQGTEQCHAACKTNRAACMCGICTQRMPPYMHTENAPCASIGTLSRAMSSQCTISPDEQRSEQAQREELPLHEAKHTPRCARLRFTDHTGCAC
jgi:hypothetical protein